MQKKAALRLFAGNLLIVIFPWISAGFLCRIPSFLAHLRKQEGNNLDFLACYGFHLFLFFLLVYELFLKKRRSWISSAFGLAEIIILQIPAVWKGISLVVWQKLWGVFPYNYFWYHLLGGIYLMGIFCALREHKKVPRA